MSQETKNSFLLADVVGGTNRPSFEPRGIPQKGLQIVCVVAIHVNDIISKLA